MSADRIAQTKPSIQARPKKAIKKKLTGKLDENGQVALAKLMSSSTEEVDEDAQRRKSA